METSVRKSLMMLLFTLIIMMYACSSSSNDDKPIISELQPSEAQKPIVEVTNDVPPINIIIPRNLKDIPDDERIKNWESYILDKYDVKIHLIFTKSYSQIDANKDRTKKAGIDIDEISEFKDTGGLIYLGSITNLKEIVDSGLVEPINNYLDDLPLIANLDDSIRNTFMDSDSNIWAFPLYHDTFASCMIYDGRWIEKWRKGTPATTDEYLQMAEFIKDSDTKSYMQAFSTSSVLGEFNQIFRAFGCYPDTSRPIGFSPQLNQYENVVLNDNFPQAIEFIKYLYDENLIYYTGDSGQEEVKDEFKVFAAKNGSDLSKYFTSPTPCYYLEGINTTKLIEENTSPICFAVLSGTEDVSLKIQTFINMVLSDEDCFMDLYAGIKGEAYEEFDTYYSYRKADDEGNKIAKPSIYVNLEGLQQKPYHSDDAEDISAYAKFKKQNSLHSKGVDIYSETDLVYSMNISVQKPEIGKLNMNIIQLTNNLMKAVIIEGSDIEAAIEEYREKVKYVTEQLNEINISLYN